jgi:hypothetical protein
MTVLSPAGVLAVADILRVQTLPTALAVYPSRSTAEEFRAARDAALGELTGRGIVTGGEVDDDLAAAISILAQPDSEIVARICRGGAMERICLSRRGYDHALAVRRGDELEVRTLWATPEDPATVARPILVALGPCPSADIPVVSAPAAELAERLDRSDASDGYAQALYDVGVPEREALGLGLALRDTLAVTEIVAYRHGGGTPARSPMAVAVYDTAQGRIIASGSSSADNQTWSTFAPGSDHRVAQAVANLIEWLSEGRSMS